MAAVYDNITGLYNVPSFDNDSGLHLVQSFSNKMGYVVEVFLKPPEDRCNSWILLPAENLWDPGMRAFFYVLALMWMFMGVAIVSDIFVGSIEVITSQKKQIMTFDSERQEMVVREVFIWNETIANLTLLALGSSAPEIMLATIEQVSNLKLDQGDITDDLGTFTIVGSAAFNLLLISAVCIVSVPSDTVRAIDEYGVFITTAAWSLFAYLWMLITLEWNTGGRVDVWEGVVTLMMFPLLVTHAWAQSKGWWRHKKSQRVRIVGVNLPREGDTRAVALDDVEDALGIEMAPTNQVKSDGPFSEMSLHGTYDQELGTSSGDFEMQHGSTLRSTASDTKIKKILSRGGSSKQRTQRGSFSRDRAVPPEDHCQHRNSMHNSEGGAGLSAKSSNASLSFKVDDDSLSQSGGRGPARFRHTAMRALVGGGRLAPNKSAKNQSLNKAAHTVRSAQHWHSLVNRKRASFSVQPGDDMCRIYLRDRSLTVIKSMGIVYLVLDITRPSRDQQGALRPDKSTIRNTLSLGAGNETVVRQATSDPDIRQESSAEAETDLPSVVLHWETRDGSACAGKAYLKDGGTVVFGRGEMTKRISVTIATDDMYEVDEEFYVVLTSAKGATIVEPSVCKIKIVDDDQPGVFSFDNPRYFALDDEPMIKVTIIREFGTDGVVEVKYHTLDGTGRGGKDPEGEDVDYASTAGSIIFQSRETKHTLLIPVNPKSVGLHRNFVVSLKSVSKGAALGEQSAAICILGDDEDPIVTRVARFWGPEEDEEISWASQFESALTLEKEIGEDGKPLPIPASVLILHFLSVFWKVLFAFIPPRHYCNGKACFLVSLFFIGAMTTVIEQLATLLGCAVNLKISVTGITLIALGTSLPDTFASRTAALQDKHADAAIGNITGSNSVNVFLGLGLPWTIASIYHAANGSTYRVSNKNLPFSVTVYLVCAFLGLMILTFRRFKYGGELGGPTLQKWMSALGLVTLWCIYVLLASLKAYGHITGF